MNATDPGRKFARVVDKEIAKNSVRKRFFVPGSLDVKTPIRMGVATTKKTKKSRCQTGSQQSANERKMNEKNEKI